jgi:hypothetical protein
MANMGPYLVEKYTKMIEAITNDLGNTADKLATAQNILRALKNPDMLVDGSPLTLERLQVMENGDIRTLPPPPDMTCIEEVTKEFVKNGKKVETAMAELVEVASDPA